MEQDDAFKTELEMSCKVEESEAEDPMTLCTHLQVLCCCVNGSSFETVCTAMPSTIASFAHGLTKSAQERGHLALSLYRTRCC